MLDDDSVFASGDTTKRDQFELTFEITEQEVPIKAIRLEAIADERLPGGGPGLAYYEGRKGTYFLSELTAKRDGQPISFVSTSQSNEEKKQNQEAVLDGNGSTGWSGPIAQTHQLVLQLAEPIEQPCELELEMLFERHFVASLGRFRFASTSDPDAEASKLPIEIEAMLAKPAEAVTRHERDRLLKYYLSVAPELVEARKPIDALREEIPSLPSTMVMRERSPDHRRVTHRHHRGEFLSPKEMVTAGIPEFLAGESDSMPKNRLELARWLVSDANPLVARVVVNRAWQAFFGAGLQRTAGDFGTQADPPTHPQLLDWVACEFIDRGWSMKELHRLIVSSATYRQSSDVRPEIQKLNAQNALLAQAHVFVSVQRWSGTSCCAAAV